MGRFTRGAGEKQRTASPEAHDQYLLGRHFHARGTLAATLAPAPAAGARIAAASTDTVARRAA